jgi:hypothetical protein
MTEAEWLTCEDPERMLAFLTAIPVYDLHGSTSRKLRLFACAAVRTVWDRLKEERCRQAVQAAELFADGLADARELNAAREGALRVWQTECWPLQLVYKVAHRAAGWEAPLAAQDAVGAMRRFEETGPAQCVLVRDIFGPLPFCSVTIDPRWLKWNQGVLLQLAEAIYDERAFDRLPILADALEDAGCTDRTILEHCRGPGPHVRGCWVVDLILGKE